MALFDFFKNKRKAKENENISKDERLNSDIKEDESPSLDDALVADDENEKENVSAENVSAGEAEKTVEADMTKTAGELKADDDISKFDADESDAEAADASDDEAADESEAASGIEQSESADDESAADAESADESDTEAADESDSAKKDKEKQKVSFFSKLKAGLSKTKNSMIGRIEDVIFRNKIDEEMMEELEETLILSDISMDTTMKITEKLRKNIKTEKIDTPEGVMEELKKIITEMIGDDIEKHQLCKDTPLVMLMIGVNGSGKTTSIAKLAHMLKQDGKKVMLAAGDTFRAAAIEQLEIWGHRVGVPVIRHQEGADPSAVVFDAIQAAKARNIDVLICDTAGRLQNKKNLMNELEKMYKIISKNFPEASKETLLVLDAATGKNAVSQVKEFGSISELTGIVLTKLDGTAKGGIVITISDEYDIPVKFIGVGEGMEDLQHFDPTLFADALFDKKS